MQLAIDQELQLQQKIELHEDTLRERRELITHFVREVVGWIQGESKKVIEELFQAGGIKATTARRLFGGEDMRGPANKIAADVIKHYMPGLIREADVRDCIESRLRRESMVAIIHTAAHHMLETWIQERGKERAPFQYAINGKMVGGG